MALRLSLPSVELINPETSEFVTFGGVELELEYSLYTISLWESKWKKPFMKAFEQFTRGDLLEFLKVMCLTPDIPETAWRCLTQKHYKAVMEYISDPMTATTVRDIPGQKRSRKIITTEQIYYSMASFGIPFECDRWHFNRLMKLLQVAAITSSPPKKMGRAEAAAYQREVFAKNRAKYNSRG